MRRFPADELRMNLSIWIGIDTAASTRRDFAGKDRAKSDAAKERIVDAIMVRLEAAQVRMVVPDMVPAGDWGSRPGSWCVDDPDPTIGLKPFR